MVVGIWLRTWAGTELGKINCEYLLIVLKPLRAQIIYDAIIGVLNNKNALPTQCCVCTECPQLSLSGVAAPATAALPELQWTQQNCSQGWSSRCRGWTRCAQGWTQRCTSWTLSSSRLVTMPWQLGTASGANFTQRWKTKKYYLRQHPITLG